MKKNFRSLNASDVVRTFSRMFLKVYNVLNIISYLFFMQ
jgi:hypothetical protein